MRASPSPLLMSKMNATKQNYHNGRHNTNYSPLHESWGDWNKKLSRKISLTSNKYIVKSSTHDLKSHNFVFVFRLVNSFIHGPIKPFVSCDYWLMSSEIHSSHCSFGWLYHSTWLLIYLLCQSISPALLQLRSHDW